MIIIEGPNGCGKTTILKGLVGCTTHSSPNGTELSKLLRPLCRGTDEKFKNIDAKSRCALFVAARYQEFAEVIKPSSVPVVTDRWFTSTYIYQVLNGNVPIEFLLGSISEEEHDAIACVYVMNTHLDICKKRVYDRETYHDPSHKHDMWTSQEDAFNKIYESYKQLPAFLDEIDIPCHVINNDTEMDLKNNISIINRKISELA